MRLIPNFTRQLEGTLVIGSAEPGTQFLLEMLAPSNECE
jgi:hypothetical protein